MPALNDSTRASDILNLWLQNVLEEHGLKLSSFMSSTSGSDSNIKRLLDKLVDFDWSWYAPHLANCALVEAMGSHRDASMSKNVGIRNLMKDLKTVIRQISKLGPLVAKFEELHVSLS